MSDSVNISEIVVSDEPLHVRFTHSEVAFRHDGKLSIVRAPSGDRLGLLAYRVTSGDRSQVILVDERIAGDGAAIRKMATTALAEDQKP